MESSKVAKINNMLAALIIAISFIVIGISGSYAFFVNEVKDGGGNKNVTVTSGNLVMTFNTVNDKYIKVHDAGLLNEGEVISRGTSNYTEFTIALNGDNNSVENAKFDSQLTELSLTSNFKSADVKWALVDVTSGEPSSLGTMTGNFSGVVWTSEAPAEKTLGVANDLT